MFPTRVPRIVAAKVITEEEVEATRMVVLNTNLKDSDQGIDPAVVTVWVTAVLGLVQNPHWHLAHIVEKDIQDIV